MGTSGNFLLSKPWQQTQKICCSILNIKIKPVSIENRLLTLQNRIQHLKKWSGTNFYEISQRNFLDIEFSLHFKNPRWRPEWGKFGNLGQFSNAHNSGTSRSQKLKFCSFTTIIDINKWVKLGKNLSWWVSCLSLSYMELPIYVYIGRE